MNADGSGQVAINTGMMDGEEPDWSPDGARIVFVGWSASGQTAIDSLYTVKPDGPGLAVIPNTEGAINPSWSPDGTKIAFRLGTHDICTISPTGQGFVNLTNSPAGVSNGNPAWSPDGSRIAFWSTRDGGTDTYTMKSDGTEARRLTTSSYNVHPTWSPDGSKLAFETDRVGNREIYVMSKDGSSTENVTRDGASDFQPNWR